VVVGVHHGVTTTAADQPAVLPRPLRANGGVSVTGSGFSVAGWRTKIAEGYGNANISVE